MKIENILSYQNKLTNALILQQFNNLMLQCHNIIIDDIVPLAYHLYNGIPLLVIDKQNLKIQGTRTKTIPLRMNQIIINGIRILKLNVHALIKWRKLVFFGVV